MPVPNMKRTMRGWTERTTGKLITQEIVNFQKQEVVTDINITLNLQPMDKETLERKPEEQRGWKWWSAIVTDGPVLELDTKVLIDGQIFRVDDSTDWSRSGFRKYDLVEDWTGRAEEAPST